MKSRVEDIAYLWKSKWAFRLALLYLAILCLVILFLPVFPLPYSPNELDLEHVFLKPFTQRHHLLGTDQLGRDVLVNCLYGARNGLVLALPVMLVATLLGTGLGTLAGYFGNGKLKFFRGTFLVLLISLFVTSYYLIFIPIQAQQASLPNFVSYTSATIGIFGMAILWFVLRPLMLYFPILTKRLAFPLDTILLRVIELITSLPKLLILISVAAFAPPSVLLLSIIFISTYWTGAARLARAEMLRIKQLTYIEAAVSAGIPDTRIIYKHAIPNLIGPLVVSFIFGVAGLLAIESTLSFLGIGLPPTFPSWGRTIAGIRSNLSAWWLVAFPGGFLALTVLALQICSYYLLRITQEKAR